MSWPLYQEVNQNNTRNYTVYRCPDPVAIITDQPWFSYNNVCPCDPNLSNTSGRGFTGCPMGISGGVPSWNISNFQLASQIPTKDQVVGNLYSMNQFVPPQLQPNPLVRVGEEWRSVN